MLRVEVRRPVDARRKALLQRMLDEQGYVVCGSDSPIVCGQVIPGLEGYLEGYEYGGFVDGPVVVIGTATAEEFVAQYNRYIKPGSRLITVDTCHWQYFCRVVAE